MLASLLLASSLFQAPERPRDIWVFRSVLDQRARIVTLALHKDLWVAYDATNCGLYRAWTGGVKFDGAVYTTVHGPQPTTIGDLHLPGIVDAPVWKLSGNSVKPEFKGYRFDKGHATLQYRFRMPENREIWVYETPEVRSTGGQVEFERKFRIVGLKDETLSLSTLSFAQPPDGTFWTDGKFEATGSKTVGGHAFSEGTLTLNATETTVKTSFKAKEVSSFDSRFLNASVPDPFVGGSEIQEPQTPREKGASLRVYWIGKDMDKIPQILSGQTPNYSAVIPQINLKDFKDFGNVAEDQFYAKVTGFINITNPGEYAFRLVSDDGSRFSIRDEIIINHDGLHGDEPKDGSFRLNAGEHPFEIDFFEQAGGEQLKLSWKTPGSSEFVLVPPEAFTTPEGEVRVTAPGKKTVVDFAKRWRPGDGLPLTAVHPSFDLETVRPKDFKPLVGGMDFLPDGRLVVCTWDPDGAVYILDGVQAKNPNDIKVKRIVAGLAEPLGLKVVDGTIYVLQKQELTKLIDHDGDEIIDEFYAVANGWGVTANFHEFAFGLVYDKGYFYAALATAIDPGGRSTQPQNPDRGKVVKISPNGDFTFAAMGLRTPNGLGIGYNGQVYIADNQGDWLPSSKILPLKEGAFYGNRSVDPIGKKDTPEYPPVVWLPQNEIGNSPSQPAQLNIGPYVNQMIHGDVTHGGVKRVFVEEVKGVLQGAVFRWTQGLEAGINRICWGPDKALYVGGIGSTGNWGQEGKERFGLQRLTYNGKSAFEPLAVRAKSNGMEVELTQPMKEDLGNGTGDFLVTMWRYVPNEIYGGPKVDERILPVKSVTYSSDRKRAFLEIPGLKEGHVVHIKMNRGLASSDGLDLWTTEAWYTLNRLPDQAGSVSAAPVVNALSADEEKEGFQLLFDGTSTTGWRGFKALAMPKGWLVKDGTLQKDPKVFGGDIVTAEQYGDFDFRIDWKLSPGGNSGIMYRVGEDKKATYHTGPEYQLLDDDLHPDGQSLLTSAASTYALIARSRDMARPAGEWNETRIVCKGGRVEHWLNGWKVVDYELGTIGWKKLVAASKFAAMPDYGSRKVGHIALQDHGNFVAFRNIRIRKL